MPELPADVWCGEGYSTSPGPPRQSKALQKEQQVVDILPGREGHKTVEEIPGCYLSLAGCGSTLLQSSNMQGHIDLLHTPHLTNIIHGLSGHTPANSCFIYCILDKVLVTTSTVSSTHNTSYSLRRVIGYTVVTVQ